MRTCTGTGAAGGLYEALLGRRLERVVHHLVPRVAVLLPRGRVGPPRGALAARLRPQRRQRAAERRQRHQRHTHGDQHRGGGVGAALRPRRYYLHSLHAHLTNYSKHIIIKIVADR